MNRKLQGRSRNGSRGVALVAVLWLVALLTLLATSAATVSVTHRRSVQALANAVQAEATADSAIRTTLLHLMAPPRARQSIQLGSAERIHVLGADVDVRIDREAARIDLNTASEEALHALFAASGWSRQQALSMASRILDWRDADDEPREEGAERAEYREAGLRYAPRNGPLESVDEVRQILGGERLSDEMLGALTVYAHTIAPAHEAAGSESRALDDSRSLIGEVLRVDACAYVAPSRSCRRAIVRLTGSVQNPFQVFVWQAFQPMMESASR